jgi:Holliday junction resolvasome RuvABC ATP-dependent DNA helicase subunit
LCASVSSVIEHIRKHFRKKEKKLDAKKISKMLILLLGPPGSGKTSLGQMLAGRLNYKWVDVDDHVLEPEWRCSVSEKLCQLGDRLFIEEEGIITINNFFAIDSVP